MARFIPFARGRVARDALLGVLHSLLEAAAEGASKAQAMQEMSEVGELCLECAKVAAVIDLVGRRSAVAPR